MHRYFHRLFSSPRLVPVNGVLCTAGIVANASDQIFCRPVTWAWVVLVLTFLPLITYNLYRDRITKGRGWVFLAFGIAACICLYCMLFLGRTILLIPFAMFIRPHALLGLLPLFLLAQIILHVRASKSMQKAFFSGILVCILFALGMANWFHRRFDPVNNALQDPGQAHLLAPDYMTELMLGMHIKYHISFCGYDGWRPPLHDPSIVVGAWLNVPFHPDPARRAYRSDFICPPPLFHGGQRVAVYRSVFPDRSLRQPCACAAAYSTQYFRDMEQLK